MADYRLLSDCLRVLAVDAVERAKSGHVGLPLGMALVTTVLAGEFLRIAPDRPAWPNRDRLVLSAGHGSMLLYGLLHLLGVREAGIDELKNFRQWGSATPGHPELGCLPGVENTSGPLGQGLANALGMAIAERRLAARAGEELIDHRTFVIAGDGCLMEGVGQEAASLAGHLGGGGQLGRLIVLFDDNEVTIDGPSSLATSEDHRSRFAACGWHTCEVDGGDIAAIREGLLAALADPRPSLVSCRTRIGAGIPAREGTAAAHGGPIGADDVAAMRAAIGWSHAPFEIPEDLRFAWRQLGVRGNEECLRWEERLAAAPEEVRSIIAGEAAAMVPRELADLRAEFVTRGARATRQSSQRVLEVLSAREPRLVGGSADLTGSNGTRGAGHRDMTPRDLSGNYLRYGVREHAMGAVMNGMALHGSIVPYGGTFLCFSDYMRPAIRLAALSGLGVIFVLSHDSIGLGEDGPTHQPVEHLAALRAMPGLRVFRPADSIEVLECWELALGHTTGPSAMVLTRQAVPLLRDATAGSNRCARGGYVLAAGDEDRVCLIATGSEVAVALRARAILLSERGIAARVVSMPCVELFMEQDAGWQREVLGDLPRVGVEAGVRLGLEPILAGGAFVGMTGYGASAPMTELFERYRITPETVATCAEEATRNQQ